jgi:hypothetical protein
MRSRAARKPVDVPDASARRAISPNVVTLEGRVRFPQMIWTGGAAADWLDVDALARVSSNPLMIFKKAPGQV